MVGHCRLYVVALIWVVCEAVGFKYQGLREKSLQGRFLMISRSKMRDRIFVCVFNVSRWYVLE